MNLDIVLLFGSMALFIIFFNKSGVGLWTGLLSNFKYRPSTCLAYHVLHSSTPPLNKIIPWFCVLFHCPQGLVCNYCQLSVLSRNAEIRRSQRQTSLKFLNWEKRSFLQEKSPSGHIQWPQDHISEGMSGKDKLVFFSISNATLLCFSPQSWGGK